MKLIKGEEYHGLTEVAFCDFCTTARWTMVLTICRDKPLYYPSQSHCDRTSRVEHLWPVLSSCVPRSILHSRISLESTSQAFGIWNSSRDRVDQISLVSVNYAIAELCTSQLLQFLKFALISVSITRFLALQHVKCCGTANFGSKKAAIKSCRPDIQT